MTLHQDLKNYTKQLIPTIKRDITIQAYSRKIYIKTLVQDRHHWETIIVNLTSRIRLLDLHTPRQANRDCETIVIVLKENKSTAALVLDHV